MEKKIILILSIVIFLFGCSSKNSSSLHHVVENETNKITDYHIKKIAYFDSKEALIDSTKYTNVYIVKVYSSDDSKYNLVYIFDHNFNVLLSQSYVQNLDGSIDYVFPISIIIDNKEINDSYYKLSIEK